MPHEIRTLTIEPGRPGHGCHTLFVRGQGQFPGDFSIESEVGFALYIEGVAQPAFLRGAKRAQVKMLNGAPYLLIFSSSALCLQSITSNPDLLVPCIDVMGLVSLCDGQDQVDCYSAALDFERLGRSLH